MNIGSAMGKIRKWAKEIYVFRLTNKILDCIHALMKYAKKCINNFPDDVHFIMTNRCNLSCAFCGQIKDKYSPKDELSLADYKSILDQIATFHKGVSVSFTGGEVFIRPDILSILEYAYSKNIRIASVITNGTLLNDEVINKLLTYKIRHLCFSIDGNERIHDQIRGVNGSYKRTVHAIQAISRIKKSNKSKFPLLSVNFVMVKDNIECIQSLLDLYLELDLNWLSLAYLVYISDAKLESHKEYMKRNYPELDFFYWEKFREYPSHLDSARLYREIECLKSRAQEYGANITTTFGFNQHQTDLWYNSDRVILNKCDYFRNSLSLLPNGDYALCDFIRLAVGNARKTTLRALWNNEKAKEFRMKVTKNIIPGCERCCHLRRQDIYAA